MGEPVERFEGEADTAWFSGTRGQSQSCTEVCAAALCGEQRDQECREPPSCVEEGLATLWLDAACAIHAAARESAGAVAWTTCGECGPSDYSNTYCMPGIIDTSTGYAYYGASIAPAFLGQLCGVPYSDARTEPLCPCLRPADAALGWTIVTILCCSLGVYVLLGVGYGRHKLPPDGGGLSLTHPNTGEGVLDWHPHRNAWGELVEVCYDGWQFSLAHIKRWRSGDSSGGGDQGGYDAVGEGGGKAEKERLVAGGKADASKRDASKRRKSEGAVRKKKRKPKPRPSRKSVPVQVEKGGEGADGDGLE